MNNETVCFILELLVEMFERVLFLLTQVLPMDTSWAKLLYLLCR